MLNKFHHLNVYAYGSLLEGRTVKNGTAFSRFSKDMVSNPFESQACSIIIGNRNLQTISSQSQKYKCKYPILILLYNHYRNSWQIAGNRLQRVAKKRTLIFAYDVKLSVHTVASMNLRSINSSFGFFSRFHSVRYQDRVPG